MVKRKIHTQSVTVNNLEQGVDLVLYFINDEEDEDEKSYWFYHSTSIDVTRNRLRDCDYEVDLEDFAISVDHTYFATLNMYEAGVRILKGEIRPIDITLELIENDKYEGEVVRYTPEE